MASRWEVVRRRIVTDDWESPMLKKFMHALAALTLVTGVMFSAVEPAEAGRGGRVAAGIAAGIIGLGLLGAYGHARDRDYYEVEEECYRGPEKCGWRGRRCFENKWGDRVCRGGRWKCWRPTYCD
jgi:hypothetical protein